MPDLATHPTPQELTAFGQGKLPEAALAPIMAHLDACPQCREAVENLPPDSFVGKVRAAKAAGASLPPQRSVGSVSALGKAAAGKSPPNVPPQLANHPKFRILRELGRGGMGVIYLAEHRVMDKPVALKVINPTVLDSPDALARFHGEARAAGKLDHQHIARAHDADQAGDLHFLVMEFVEGVSLAQLVEKKGPLPIGASCHYIRQAALGLQHAFEQGMVHRDIKPHNLMVTPKGQVKILDFGLARMRSERRSGGAGLTQADSFMGTPEYVSPEQATDARSADTRADIYSLGCTLYFLLTGRPPFQEETIVKLVLAHIEKEPRPVHELRPDVLPELSAAVSRMLAKDPAQRFQKPVEVAQALLPFIKTGAKPQLEIGGAPVPPATASPAKGTVIGGDTSRVPGLGKGATRLPAKAAGIGEKESRFADLGTAPVVAPKKSKKDEPRAESAQIAWWKRPKVLAGAGVGALALILLLAGVVFKVSTKDGVLVVEVNEPNADVFIGGGKVAVTWADGGKHAEMHIKPGAHKVEVKKDGFTVSGDEVIVESGGRKIFTASLRKVGDPRVADAKVADAGGFVPLFNGKDLTGWKTHPSQPGNWRVENGILIGSGPGLTSHLYTQRGDYKDFHLRVEARINDGGNSGLIFRTEFGPEFPANNPRFLSGYEAQINSTHGDPNKTGSLYVGGGGAMVSIRESPVPADQWFTEEVIAQDNHIIVKVNGKTTADFTDEKRRHRRGLIALQQHNPETVAEFRKIEIKEQSATASAVPKAAQTDGFVPLFNGKDLTGWHVVRGDADDWQVEQGGIGFTGADKAHPSILASDKEYTDYAVRFEFQAGDKALAGFVVRSMPGYGSLDIPGGSIAITGEKRAGSCVWSRQNDYLSSSPEPQLQPPEDWNRMEIRLHGRRLRVLVNGAQVQNLNLDQIPDRPLARPYWRLAKGTIEFRKIVGTVRMRNIEWCDLSNTPPPTDPVSPAKLGIYPQGRQAVGVGQGEWLREGDELVQTGLNPTARLFFGDVEWTDYDFSCEAMRVEGPNGFEFIVRATDKYNFYILTAGGWGNTKHAWSSVNEGVFTEFKGWRDARVNANQWYRVRVSVRGPRCQSFGDDKLILDFTDQNHLRGAVGLVTVETKARFRNIKVTAPDGKVLWKGVPELDAVGSGK
jgi:hypothetical protein